MNSGTNKKWASNLLKAESSNSRLSREISSCFKSRDFSDCIIACGSKEFYCHKVILAGRSTVFKAMFLNDLDESISGKVEIEDLDEDAVEEMLNYIYSGTVKKFEGLADKLLTAADKYDLSELKEECELYLCEKISISNVCDLLIIAYLHSCTSLQSAALQFLSTNGRNVMVADELKLYPDILVKMFEASCNI